MHAQQKQEAIKQAFKDWIFKDPERRQTLVRLYNHRFNSVRPREYDGSHLDFAGISPDITLRQHQLNAVAHIIYGGNTLLAHEVGAGNTFEMVAAAMESKRLGLCQKSLLAVPNHLTEQPVGTASCFQRPQGRAAAAKPLNRREQRGRLNGVWGMSPTSGVSSCYIQLNERIMQIITIYEKTT